MKKIVTVFIVLLILPVTMVIMAQPEEPASDCTVKNVDLSRYCLSHIPKYYDADFLTYLGHTRAWAYRRADKVGIKLGKQQLNYLANYSSFEDAVNCHLTASGDASLNMTITPAAFDATFDRITRRNRKTL